LYKKQIACQLKEHFQQTATYYSATVPA